MRERPPGCKTVFVGGLPENASEDMITEVFAECGEIIAIRKSKKNFCHIRFSHESMVDKALFLSGNFYLFHHFFFKAFFNLNISMVSQDHEHFFQEFKGGI